MFSGLVVGGVRPSDCAVVGGVRSSGCAVVGGVRSSGCAVSTGVLWEGSGHWWLCCVIGKVLPFVQVKARDQNALVSGYLLSHTSKTRRWRRKWYVVYQLVLYEFERHEVSTRCQCQLWNVCALTFSSRIDTPRMSQPRGA